MENCSWCLGNEPTNRSDIFSTSSEMNDSVEEQQFKDVKSTLEGDGRLGKFTSELRSAVMTMLNARNSTDQRFNQIPNETRLINDLIREYLVWNGYIYTEEFLVAESGATKEKPSRQNLTQMMGVMDDCTTTKVPLLYYIIYAFQNQDEGNA